MFELLDSNQPVSNGCKIFKTIFINISFYKTFLIFACTKLAFIKANTAK